MDPKLGGTLWSGVCLAKFELSVFKYAKEKTVRKQDLSRNQQLLFSKEDDEGPRVPCA